MPAISLGILRHVFALGEATAPRLAGRLAFELFCRTPAPGKMSPGEQNAMNLARQVMENARPHRLPTADGEVSVYDFPPAGKSAPGTVLVIHGWRSRTEHLRVLIAALRDAGFRVVSLDLPGHGASSGRRLNMANAVGAVDAVAKAFGPLHAMVGHSFGGAVAINAAVGSVAGCRSVGVQRLVVIAAPSSMPLLFGDFARHLRLGPRTQSALQDHVQRVTGRPLDTFQCGEQLRKRPIPTLVTHDTGDREVTPAHAKMTAGAGDHVVLRWTEGLGHRRIVTDADVAKSAAAFVTAGGVACVPA